MDFRKAFIISTIIHLLFPCILIIVLNTPENFDIMKGLSSLYLQKNSWTRRINEEKSKKVKERELIKDLHVLISSESVSEIQVDSRLKRRNKPLPRNKMENKNTKEIIGALYHKASYLSKNRSAVYPYIARKLKYEGKVSLLINVKSDGNVGWVRIESSSGYDILDRSAVEAASSWIFFQPGEFQFAESITIKKTFVFILHKKYDTLY